MDRLSRAERRYLSGATVWVTGATSGIGRALAVRIAPACRRLVISSRRTEELERLRSALAPADVIPVPLELACDASIAAALDQLADTKVDVLINCAGVSQRGTFVETDVDVFRTMVEVNLLGTASLTHGVAKSMVARGDGHLVAVTSLAGVVGAYRRSGYAAAKHGLHGLFDSLRPELAGTGVRVSVVVPGFVRTAISDNALLPDGSAHAKTDARQATGMSADRCATKMLRVLAHRRDEYRVAMGLMGTLTIMLRRIAPRLLWKLMRRFG